MKTHAADARVYATILRDGPRCEDTSLSWDTRLRIARRLDALGVSFIEGG